MTEHAPADFRARGLLPSGRRACEDSWPRPADWALDWARFIDIEPRPNGVTLDGNGKTPDGKAPSPQQLEENKRRLQMAYRIDTSIVFPLGSLPPDVADLIIPSLAERNLVRGWRLRLPSGQSVAKAMGEPS